MKSELTRLVLCRQGNKLYKQVLGAMKTQVTTLMDLQRHHVPSQAVLNEVQIIRASLAKFGLSSTQR